MKKKVSELKVGDLVTNDKGIYTVGSVEIIESVPVTYKVIYEDIDKPKLYFDNQELEVLPPQQESRVRAKFLVTAILFSYNKPSEVVLDLINPTVINDLAINTGSIRLQLTPGTSNFVLGQEYYVDFIKANVEL